MSFCFHALKSSTRFNQIILHHLIKSGYTDLTPSLLGIFAHLTGEETMSVSALANVLGVSRQAMHKSTTNLQKCGYITLETGLCNRKEKMVLLTPKGEKLVRQSLDIIAKTEQKMKTFLGIDAYETFLKHQAMLSRFLEHLQS